MNRTPFIIVCCLLAACAPAPTNPVHDLAIANVTIIDGTGAASFVGSVYVDGGAIAAIVREDGANLQTSRSTIDGAGKYLIPGLIDSHVHMASFEDHPEMLDALLDAGITTVRDMGARPGTVEIWSREVATGKRRGPEVLYVGQTLNGAEGVVQDGVELNFHRAVETKEEARQAIADMKALGAVHIKVHNLISPSALPAVIDAAATQDMRVVGHIPAGPGPLKACEMGMAEIAHASALLEAALWREPDPAPGLMEAIVELTGEESDALYDCMSAHGMAFAPNLSMYDTILTSLPEEQRAMTARLVAKLGEAALRASAKGVRIIASTDSNGTQQQVETGRGLHVELEMLVQSGFTPMAALMSATSNPAAHFGRKDIGVLKVGADADFLLLCADPLADISNTTEISAVIADGAIARQGADC